MNIDSNALLGGRTSSAPPVRIVHLGLGAFHRSHQAWYTARSSDAAEWGIAAHSGRSAALADALTAQDCLYTLVVRSPQGDSDERIDSIVRAHPGSALGPFLVDLAAPETAIVTLTITEAAYADPDMSVDRDALAGLSPDGDLGAQRPVSALGRLVLGLEARRRAAAPPIAVVSCDNLPDNGGVLRRAVMELAAPVAGLSAWIMANVSFVSSSVDRITPRVDAEEASALRSRLGDRAPVVTEPFADWVLEGVFPAGRPDWESAGARVVDDLEPWEARKLWLLNGAHTLLASLGQLRGHREVAEAIADDECRRAVEAYWDEACQHLPDRMDLAGYRAALLERFANPRIVHLLSQIALDASTKMRVRIVPVALRERRAGRSARGCATAVAAWLALEQGAGDTGSEGDIDSRLRVLSAELADDDEFVEAVHEAFASFSTLTLR